MAYNSPNTIIFSKSSSVPIYQDIDKFKLVCLQSDQMQLLADLANKSIIEKIWVKKQLSK